MKKKYFLWPALLILIGCSGSIQSQQEFPQTIKLQGKRWYIGEKLGRVANIRVAGHFLTFKNELQETRFSAIDLRDTTQIYHFGKRGAGPGELINAGVVLTDSTSVSVDDLGKRAFFQYDLNKIKEGYQLSARTLFRTPSGSVVASLAALPDSNYAMSGIFPEGQLCLLDKNGKKLAYSWNYPKEQPTDMPFHVLGMAYLSRMCRQPSGKRIAMAAMYGEILQIYEWTPEKTIKNIAVINRTTPKFTTENYVGTSNFAPTKGTKWAYISIDATDKYIFMLYSGRLQLAGNQDPSEGPCHLGKTVHVFDWDGNPLYQLKLDHNGESLAVKGNKLFLLAENAEIGNDIVEYRLSIK